MICDDDCYRTVKTMIPSTESIVIDEVSMLSRKIFETVECLCRACYRTVKIMILSTESIVIGEEGMLSRKIFETVEGLCRACYRTVMILSTESIVIDEVSMLSRKIFETVEDLCSFIRNNNYPFGGLQFILVGDFYQLRPVWGFW